MYIPHTSKEKDEMLAAIGVEHFDDLFKDVPENHRFPEIDLPDPVSEMEVVEQMQETASSNQYLQDLTCFRGAGAYHHYIPAAVDSILRRGEFYTAYTPYQPEISQGTLQAIFDYQSLITALTGMDVSNASHYDGATSAAEAISLADAYFRGKRSKIVISPSLHPQYRQTIKTYNTGSNLNIIDATRNSNLTDGPDSLIPYIDKDTALVFIQYPDFFGRVYDPSTYLKLADAIHQAGGLLAVSANPMALGLLKPPSSFEADIVTGEGQPLGIPLSYGGPYLGIFTTRKKYVRKMAGRLVGESIDDRGQRAYTLTLTAREQHIRRERATSNICTNQGLIALAAAVYLSLLGKQGLHQVAELCYHKAHYAAEKIKSVKGFDLWSSPSFFNEFVVQCPLPVEQINNRLLQQDILGGYDLGQDYPQLENHMLIAVTEMNSKNDIDSLADVLAEVPHD